MLNQSTCVNKRSIMLALLLSLTAASAMAGLEWETTSKAISVKPLQEVARIDFNFTNTGNDPVKIQEVQSECGCISGQADKTTVQPGESGTVEVTFVLTGRTGPQDKGLSVITDEPNAHPIRLEVSTTIPDAFSVSTKRLGWKKGEALEPKSISVTNMTSSPIRIEEATTTSEDVTVEVKTVREGYEYTVVVTPVPGVEKAIAPITIRPEKPEELVSVKTYKVYAIVGWDSPLFRLE